MDYDALEKRLREHATDWDGSQMPDAEPAKSDPTSGDMRKAADAIADLRARNKALCDIIFRYVDPCDVLPEDDAVVAGAIAANREG